MRRAEGDLVRSGDAKGTIQISQFGILIEYEFVVLGKTIFLKGATGGWQQLDAAVASSIYDPSAILDPDRGIAKLLSTAKDPKTEAKESVDGKDAYRVAVTLAGSALSALVPGVGADATGKLWVDAQTKQLLKAVLTVPGASAGKTGTVTINVSNIDVPVTVSAP
jgi:lipoprotein LprG